MLNSFSMHLIWVMATCNYNLNVVYVNYDSYVFQINLLWNFPKLSSYHTSKPIILSCPRRYPLRKNYVFYDCCKNQLHFFLSLITQATDLIAISNNFIVFDLFMFSIKKLIYMIFPIIDCLILFTFLLLGLILLSYFRIQKIGQDYYNHLVNHHQKYHAEDHYLE